MKFLLQKDHSMKMKQVNACHNLLEDDPERLNSAFKIIFHKPFFLKLLGLWFVKSIYGC